MRACAPDARAPINRPGIVQNCCKPAYTHTREARVGHDCGLWRIDDTLQMMLVRSQILQRVRGDRGARTQLGAHTLARSSRDIMIPQFICPLLTRARGRDRRRRRDERACACVLLQPYNSLLSSSSSGIIQHYDMGACRFRITHIIRRYVMRVARVYSITIAVHVICALTHPQHSLP